MISSRTQANLLCLPCMNFLACLKTKPPIVLFTFGMLAIGSALAYFSLYVKTHNDILDPNISMSWNSLLLTLNGVKWCESSNQSHADRFDANVTNASSVSILTTINMSFSSTQMLINDNILHGKLQHGALLVPDDKSIDHYIKVYFHIIDSNITRASEYVMVPVCLTLQTEAELLPARLRKPAACGLRPAATALLVEPCSNNQTELMALAYQFDPQLRDVLSDDDRRTIHLHLLTVSVFFFISTLSVMIFGVVASHNGSKPQLP